MSINITTQTGNVGSNCQVHQTANTTIASFPLAISSGFGQNQKTSWVTCKLFGKRADSLAQYLLKGVKVAVSGQLSVEEWEKEGVKHSKTVILVSDIDITNFKSEAGSKDDFVQENTPKQPDASLHSNSQVATAPMEHSTIDDFPDDLPF